MNAADPALEVYLNPQLRNLPQTCDGTGDGQISHLAGTSLDDDVAVLADGAGLLRVGLGGAGVGLGLELVLLVRHLRESYRDPIATVTREEWRQQEEEERRKVRNRKRRELAEKLSRDLNRGTRCSPVEKYERRFAGRILDREARALRFGFCQIFIGGRRPMGLVLGCQSVTRDGP